MDQSATPCAKLSGRQFSLGALLVLLAIVSIALAIYVRYYLLGVVCSVVIAGIALVALGAARQRTRLMGLGALVAALGLVVLLVGGSTVIYIGQSLVSLTFIVVDADTDQPVSGATVRLRDLPFASEPPAPEIPPGEPGVEARTNNRGRSTITYKFISSGTSGLLVRDTATARLWEPFHLQVSADGYETLILPLREVAGHVHDLTWPQQPPPIELRLKPTK